MAIPESDIVEAYLSIEPGDGFQEPFMPGTKAGSEPESKTGHVLAKIREDRIEIGHKQVMTAHILFEFQLSDAEIMLSSVEDVTKFGEIFERHYEAIEQFLVRRVGLPTAEDLASQTFVVALERRSSYDPHPSGARPWLYGIATNLVSNFRRQEVRRLRAFGKHGLLSGNDTEDAIFRSDESSTSRSTHERVALLLADLDPDMKDALLLFTWAGLSYEEISVALNIAVGTVGSRISRARQSLAVGLGVDGEMRSRRSNLAKRRMV
jgi:RNA polymerase sigma factor (sigma-70 family)